MDVIGPHVAKGHYDLVGPNGEIILRQFWESMVQPDWSVTMHMWPMPESSSTAPGPTPGSIFEKPEEGKRDSVDSNSSTASRYNQHSQILGDGSDTEGRDTSHRHHDPQIPTPSTEIPLNGQDLKEIPLFNPEQSRTKTPHDESYQDVPNFVEDDTESMDEITPTPLPATSQPLSDESHNVPAEEPVLHRWAKIRKNAADRAAQRQREELNRPSDNGKMDSGDESIEVRVARIKARVAELTGNM